MNKQRFVITLLVILLLSIFWIAPVQAQVQGGGWSVPYRLSSEAGKASEASLVADPYGYVHCFWTEILFGSQRTILQYARFDGETWTMPNDIYVTGHEIGNLSSAVDQHGMLHLVWTEGRNGPVFYTHAPASNALAAETWSSPIRIAIPAGIVRSRVDSKGVMHIVYVDQLVNLGVYYLRSSDQGQTWSEPVWLDPDIPSNYTPQDLNFELDDTDGLHAVWNYGALDDAAPISGSMRYAHSLDGGDTWSLPLIVDQYSTGDQNPGASGPRMIVQGQTVHVIWGAGEQPYRHHRFSTDAGKNWSLPRRIFGNLHGQAWDGLAIDGAGRVHYFGQIRYPIGIYHAYWDQGWWSQPTLVYLIAEEDSADGIGNRVHAHFTLPVIRAGNQLVLTFTDGPADLNRRLFVMYRTLDDIPPLESLPTPDSIATPIPLSSETPSQPTSTPYQTATPPSLPSAEVQPLGRAPGPDFAIRAALVPILLLLGGTFVFRLWYKHKS